MKTIVVRLLAIGFAGAMFATSSVQANDTEKANSSHQTRPCRKVTVAAMSKIPHAASSGGDANFGSDYYNQHPSGGG